MASSVRYFLRTKFRDFPIISSFSGRQGERMDRFKKENVFSKILGPFESYVVSLQSLLIWERPYLSAVALVAVNCAFWVIVSCSRRFYSFLSVVALIVLLYRTWVYQVWPEIRVPPSVEEDSEEWTPVHPQVLSVPELSQHLNDWWVTLCAWWDFLWRFRRNHPGMFCIIVCGIFACSAVIGKIIPGVIMVYLLVMAVSLGPGVALYVIPRSWYHSARAIVGLSSPEHRDPGTGSPDSEVDDFLPNSGSESFLAELTPTEALAVSEQRDELQVARELGLEILVREASEQEDSLTHGLGTFPDVEEVSEEEDEEETRMSPKVIGEQVASSSSDSNNGNGIHFVATHFKEESSESDAEEAFIKGLSFPPTPDPNESSLSRPLSVSQRLAPTASTCQPQALSHSSHGRLEGKAGADEVAAAAVAKQSTSQCSDVDISEYEMVSESELSS